MHVADTTISAFCERCIVDGTVERMQYEDAMERDPSINPFSQMLINKCQLKFKILLD